MRAWGPAICLVAAVAWTHAASGQAAGGAAEGLFDPSADGAVLELAPEAERDALASSLADAGRNWVELARALTALEEGERASCAWLVNHMPHLDRIEMKAETLIEHVRYAHAVRSGMPYRMPDDMFEPYILTYRIEEEPLDPWRKALHDRFAPFAFEEGTAAGTARRINAFLAESLEEREPQFFGPRKSPLLTLASGGGSEAENAILACAAMKAVGIPSRQAQVAALGEEFGDRSWIEVFDGHEWLPLYPRAPEAFGDFGFVEREHEHDVTVVATTSAFEQTLVTERYTDTATIDLAFVEEGAPAGGFETFSVNALNRGGLAALDALETAADDSGRFAATVGEGTYVVLAGTRDPAGNASVTMQQVTLAPGDTAYLAFDVSPESSFAAFTAEELSRCKDLVEAWIAVDLSQEPSARMLPLIARAVARRAPAVRAHYVTADPSDAGTVTAAAGPEATVSCAPPGPTPFGPTSLDLTSARLPVVALYAAGGGAAILRLEGYDLNVERAILAAVDERIAGALGR